MLVEALEAEGVDRVFGYPGGAIMPVYDALTAANLRHILSRHEQGAAFAALAYGRVKGQVGVCMATSGPGATNLVTGIADAFLDSHPLVAITGQVSSPLMGTDAFQEVDIFGITLPIVKHSYIVRHTEEIPSLVAEAFDIARSGRPGPVLIDLPKDVAMASCSEPWAALPSLAPPEIVPPETLKHAEVMIAKSEKPLFYIGGGVNSADAVDAMRALVGRTGIPAVSTLKGLGTLASDNPDLMGMLGMHGSKVANFAVQESDLLIVCGARFDDRATGKLDTFAPNAKIIHMDVDPSEVNKLRTADIGVGGDLRANLYALDPGPIDISRWRARMKELKETHPPRYDAPASGIYAPKLLRDLSRKAGRDAIIAASVGQHQMWVAQHCLFSRPEHHLTSGGLGTMGFGLPAGIGAKMARPDACVITVTGDGSVMMNIQELATIKRYGVALKIIVLDNSCLGMVRQWQELFYDQNYSEVDLSDNPDFVRIAEAFEIEAFAIERPDEVAGGIDRLLAAEGPILMHVKIDKLENVWPLVPPGKSNADMMEG